MRILHLTLLAFCQVLLAAFVLYSALASASPLAAPKDSKTHAEHRSQEAAKSPAEPQQAHPPAAKAPALEAAAPARKAPAAPRDSPVVHRPASGKGSAKSLDHAKVAEKKPVEAPKPAEPMASPLVAAESMMKPKSAVSQVAAVPQQQAPSSPISAEHKTPEESVVKKVEPVVAAQPDELIKYSEAAKVAAGAVQPVVADKNYYKVDKSPVVPQQAAPQPAEPVAVVAPKPVVESSSVVAQKSAVVEAQAMPQVAQQVHPQVAKAPVEPQMQSVVVVHEQQQQQQQQQSAPLVKGGLGPLHLLAATLCSYQPEKPVADETLNLLYSRRASLRKSLFDFMSLKFTNLEKLSSRLNPGLEVMPQKTTDAGQSASVAPSHGWPVVGKCTAHDLKLMAEAAWCEASEQSPMVAPQGPQASSQQAKLDEQEPKITSNQHRANAARALAESEANSVPFDQSAVISKILHVTDVKDAPVVESSIASLNLTQQQLATIQDQATSTRECRRKALRLTKSLFNHLAEDQRNGSESWPKLYAQMAEDECARKRMIDIVSALSDFRGESTSIRRDNVEFAFAMDDLRSKVLESEVNTPLTFDKQFIEVEQFLQQSVKLMLANIDPERARLTSMRYRSFMPGPVSADDQCIELHQRLLAKNYPTDCNPNQFGQLPDVLRMAASSLELWSIEKELGKHSAKIQDYPATSPCVLAAKQHDVNECIANLVTS